MNYYIIGDHVKVVFGIKNRIEFTGVIERVEGTCFVIKPDVMTKDIQAVRHENLDPIDCIIIHKDYIIERLVPKF